jgi:glycosyltransferase involved in cell wall biosynthesis
MGYSTLQAGHDAVLSGVSVVIPTYNGADVLGEQLDSLAGQSMAPDEVLIADNGSTDETVEVALTYVDCLPVRVVDASARRGNAAARNIGAGYAQYEFILFLDQDDYADSAWVRAITNDLSDTVIVVGRNILQRDWDGERTVSDQAHPDLYRFLPYGLSNNMGISAAGLRSLGGFDERYEAATDLDLCWRAQENGFRLVQSHTAVVFKRTKSKRSQAFAQHRAFGVDDVLLFVNHVACGMKRDWRQLTKRVVWLLLRTPKALFGDRIVRDTWIRVVGQLVGRVEGSIKYRKLYL